MCNVDCIQELNPRDGYKCFQNCNCKCNTVCMDGCKDDKNPLLCHLSCGCAPTEDEIIARRAKKALPDEVVNHEVAQKDLTEAVDSSAEKSSKV